MTPWRGTGQAKLVLVNNDYAHRVALRLAGSRVCKWGHQPDASANCGEWVNGSGWITGRSSDRGSVAAAVGGAKVARITCRLLPAAANGWTGD